jgi:hypothetical protein
MIKLTKKAIELLDAITSVPYSRKGLGYTIGRGLDAVLPFTCYSYWFTGYFDQRGKLMNALNSFSADTRYLNIHNNLDLESIGFPMVCFINGCNDRGSNSSELKKV